MKVILLGYVMLLVVLIGVTAAQERPGNAVESLVLYDDFNATQIDPDKWFGGEFGPKLRGADKEAIRQIQDNRLRLVYRSYGQTDSDSGRPRNEFLLTFPNSAAVTAIKATVQVTDAVATSCPGNPETTIAWAKLGGVFFSTAPSTPMAFAFARAKESSSFADIVSS